MTLENMKSHLVRFVKQNRSQGFKRTDLYHALQLVETNEMEALFFTALDELVTENKIYFHYDQERYYWMAPTWYYGRLKMHPKGYGFVTLTDQNYQLAEEYEKLTFFVARDSLTKALDGDVVIIEVPRFTADEKMKPAAILIASIKRYHHFVVGVLKRTYRHKYYLVITNVKLQHYFSHIINIDEKE